MTTDAIWSVLRSVMDPEIPVVSVVDLGIVRDVSPNQVTITPTYSGCPATDFIERSIREALDSAGFREVAVRTTLSPPWTTDWISERGKEALRAYGIAPPDLAKAATASNATSCRTAPDAAACDRPALEPPSPRPPARPG
jgi:ring-1,2-phenylacetyl-CoA epoxidase subunit PaaD